MYVEISYFRTLGNQVYLKIFSQKDLLLILSLIYCLSLKEAKGGLILQLTAYFMQKCHILAP